MQALLGIVFCLLFLPLILQILGEILHAVLPFLILGALIGAFVGTVHFVHRYGEAIARWYYFTFHPHPAEPAVRSALAHGRLLDGDRLAAALAEVPPYNRILREVRIAQGELLVAEMRHASEGMIRETIKNAQAENARAAVLGIQEAIALAAVALERAKAADAASRSVP